MKWFCYRQANSGGYFIEPAIYVAVQAENHDQANEIALKHGVYFDGTLTGRDCQCCGNRWYRMDEGSEESVDFNPATDCNDTSCNQDKISTCVAVYRED